MAWDGVYGAGIAVAATCISLIDHSNLIVCDK